MSGKMFDKSIKKSCVWCIYGKKSEYSDEVFCKKRGVTSSFDSCRKYKYDPLKRIPDNSGIGGDYSPEDFKL
ncbi:MAG: hypothetical protein IKZ59_04665 [Clostridia bacterium]|nr:hypothetical protein [Clostridia bacterium]